MNAILSLNHHKDPQVFRVNELEDHAYFIPFATKEQTSLPREKSPFFHSLNGVWRFLWRPSIYEFEDFFAPDYDLSSFEEITLPECWQTHGKDYAQYQASAYPFLADPPHIPEKNPVASYVKDFDIVPVAGKRYELHFEGKDSCVYVWLNGHFVGYGEVPHNDSAFDVTPYLQSGANRLCVAVLKWCTGTYFDDQDKLRLSGIFRDVYLLERAEQGVRDLALTADQTGRLDLTVTSGAPVRASVFEGERLLGSAEINGNWQWQCEAPRLWSAEAPHLYDLVLECAGEVIRRRFGFRTVAIQNGVFTVNGKPVKFNGVNRHDTAPDVGYAVDETFVRAELVQMKQHNVNAIRTAHYPNAPYFYDLCDELGFYVMCEADQECHGMTYLQNWGGLVNDPLWAPCIHDRMVRMYEAFKNSPAIVIWSLGNEAGWGQNLNNEAIWFHQIDPTRPVHYEGAFNAYTKLEEDELIRRTENIDLLSAMYPPLSDNGGSRAYVQASLEHPAFAKMPYVMCEYSHAMGNSCGDLTDYWEMIYAYDSFFGGCIWEFTDHAVQLDREDANGRPKFVYVGDFG